MTKFKFIGENDSYCLELMAFGLEKKGEYLQKGQIIDVPKENTTVIDSLNASGNFVKVNYTVNKPKNKKKEIKD